MGEFSLLNIVLQQSDCSFTEEERKKILSECSSDSNELISDVEKSIQRTLTVSETKALSLMLKHMSEVDEIRNDSATSDNAMMSESKPDFRYN